MVDTKPDVHINTQNVNGRKNKANQNPIPLGWGFFFEKGLCDIDSKEVTRYTHFLTSRDF